MASTAPWRLTSFADEITSILKTCADISKLLALCKSSSRVRPRLRILSSLLSIECSIISHGFSQIKSALLATDDASPHSDFLDLFFEEDAACLERGVSDVGDGVLRILEGVGSLKLGERFEGGKEGKGSKVGEGEKEEEEESVRCREILEGFVDEMRRVGGLICVLVGLLRVNCDPGMEAHGISPVAKSLLTQDHNRAGSLPSRFKLKNSEGYEMQKEIDTQIHVFPINIDLKEPLPPEPDGKNKPAEEERKGMNEKGHAIEEFRLSGASTIPTTEHKNIDELEKSSNTDSFKPKILSKQYQELHKAIKSGLRDENLAAVKALLKEAVDNSCIPLSELESGDISFLGEAIKVGFIPMILLLLEYGVDIESIAVHSVGYGALHWATSRNQIDVVRILLQEGVNITKKTTSNETALFIACRKGLLEIVKLLLFKEFDGVSVIEEVGKKDRTPLQEATLQGHSSTVEVLLESGANVHSLNSRGDTSLHIAAENGHVETARVLIKHDATIDARDQKKRTPLHVATCGGHVVILELLMEYGTELDALDASKATPLHLASRNGHFEAAELLVAYGADIEAKDEYYWTPLHFATYNKRHKIINLLLSSGAQVDAKSNTGKTSLMRAAELDDPISITTLSTHGADTNITIPTSGFAAVHFAAQEGSLHALETLISLPNINLEQQTANESTPLIIASWRGWAEIVKRLLAANVNIHHQRSHNITALCDAVSSGHVSVCEILLSNGANIDHRDADKETPLMVAAAKNHVAVVKGLLEAGASFDAKDNNGYSALYTAAMNGHVDAVEILLDSGASVNAVTRWNGTALHVAAFKGHGDVVKLLLRRGAERGVVVMHKGMKGTPAEVAVEKGIREMIEGFEDEPLIRNFVVDDGGDVWNAENRPTSAD